MNFNGRWVPVEVMEAIFGLWGMIALLVFGATYWMCRAKTKKHDQDKPLKRERRKRNRRKKRKLSI